MPGTVAFTSAQLWAGTLALAEMPALYTFICDNGVPAPSVNVLPFSMTTGTAKAFCVSVSRSFQFFPSPGLLM